MAESVEALHPRTGVIAIRGAFADTTAIDRTNDHFWAIIEDERRGNIGGGDHFAKPGATTAFGTRSRSSACATRRRSPPTMAMR